MKRIEPQLIGDVLRISIQESKMAGKLDERRAIEFWAPLVGDYMAKQCGRPTVRDGVMTVSVPGAALRHELTMSRSLLIRLINEKLGKQVIKEIRFIS